jgi:hypothetical protein
VSCSCPPPPPATTGPIIGVVDGSSARPGEVGEVMRITVQGNFTDVSQVQAVSTLILSPGDWDYATTCYCAPVATTGSQVLSGLRYQSVESTPAGVTPIITWVLEDIAAAGGASGGLYWPIIFSLPAQATVAVPTLLAFNLYTNYIGTGSAGLFYFTARARRMR